jgi:hypothetical protein
MSKSTKRRSGLEMPPRFVADSMVGRLAKWLRAFGFDVVYDPFADDDQVVAWAREREATLLTRDTGITGGAGVRVVLIEHDAVEDQLRQLVEGGYLDLSEARPLTRCTVCNEGLTEAGREEVRGLVPPFVYATQSAYARCGGCGRVYWEGSHVPRIRERLERLAGKVTGDE